MYLAARKGDECIAFEEIKDALSKKVGDDADMVSKIEAIPEMNAFVSIQAVIVREGLKYP